jgi:hypothetical protein
MPFSLLARVNGIGKNQRQRTHQRPRLGQGGLFKMTPQATPQGVWVVIFESQNLSEVPYFTW